MEYPSFIWEKDIGKNRTLCPIIQGNVLTDLKIDDLLEGEMKKYALIPCVKSEIEKRQTLFRTLEDNPEVEEVLLELKETVRRYKSSIYSYDRSETEMEKGMFFAVLAAEFLNVCNCLASCVESSSVFFSVSDFFRAMLRNAFFQELAGSVQACFASRGDHVRLCVKRDSLSASVNTKPMQIRFEEWFRHMEIGDELPRKRAKRRPDQICLEAYGEAYSSFTRQAESLRRRFADALLGEEHHIRDLLYYGEEMDFLIRGARFIKRLREYGYPLCYPAVSSERKILGEGLVDTALLSRELPIDCIVPNDVEMWEEKGGERLSFFLLTGANGGGKTTYLRSVGSMVLLFLMGLPVTAKKGQIYPFRSIFTHFPSNESFQSSGRFADEERRVMEIIDGADCDCVALFNETYSGTDERKSEEYSRRLALAMSGKGVFGLFVTHIHALTEDEGGKRIPVLCAEVDESDENKRTYRIRRAEFTRSSYAQDILKKYRLDRESLAALEGVQ